MPVRCRIHSSLVSMRRDIRSFVTTPSGTNIPEDRITVVGGTARDAIRSGRPRSGSAERVDLDVARDGVHLGGPDVEEHPLGGFDDEPAVVLVGRAEGGHHRVDADGSVLPDRYRRATRLLPVPVDRDNRCDTRLAGVEEEE